jgi:hypothetical protein
MNSQSGASETELIEGRFIGILKTPEPAHIIDEQNSKIRTAIFNIREKLLEGGSTVDVESAFSFIGVGSNDLISVVVGITLDRRQLIVRGEFLVIGRHADIGSCARDNSLAFIYAFCTQPLYNHGRLAGAYQLVRIEALVQQGARSMVPKSGSQLPNTRFALSDPELAMQIGAALREELGASRRATKTVMRWTGVSDRAARSWLQGRASPSGLHLVALAARSEPVLMLVLRLAGHADLEIGIRLRSIEAELLRMLAIVQLLKSSESQINPPATCCSPNSL